jgi:fumigallin biosynthesis monooxygenase-like protein
MATITTGRWTHDHEGGVVVFLIGARVNRMRAVRSWWPVLGAMPRMLKELQQDPASGLLSVTSTVHGRGSLMVQYWRDLESLLAYAHAPEYAHRPAWHEFNRAARAAGHAVGIWHETFVVPPGHHESIYVDMPEQGLPRALGRRRVDHRLDGLRQRMPAPHAA